MKNLYPKGKGRIHPSPSAPAAPGCEVVEVLSLLPAAILFLTAVLGNDDKEVLAYLMIRSISLPEEAAEQRRCGRPGELHTSVFGCGCFDCYTSFWSRWDCSPDRELIHQAIEAFEEHLASSERAGVVGKGRRRERRAGDLQEKGKRKGKDKEPANHSETPPIPIIGEEADRKSSEGEGGEATAEEAEKGDRQEEMEVAERESAEEMPASQAVVGERRKGWADVTAIFNSRLWSLWSPGD